MKLVFVRHAEPDYAIDSLTEKGFREAALLGQRAAGWHPSEVYVSPLGRAKATAQPSLDAWGMQAQEKHWLREFSVLLPHPKTGARSIPWDLMPADWTEDAQLFDNEMWMHADRYHISLAHDGSIQNRKMENPVYGVDAVASEAAQIYAGIDEILAAHGYVREGKHYHVAHRSDDLLVFFAHLAVIDVILSHLLNISAPLLWHGFFLAPSSVTILGAEEREPGTAYFRTQVYGDTAHLLMGGEPVSQMGYFTESFSL